MLRDIMLVNLICKKNEYLLVHSFFYVKLYLVIKMDTKKALRFNFIKFIRPFATFGIVYLIIFFVEKYVDFDSNEYIDYIYKYYFILFLFIFVIFIINFVRHIYVIYRNNKKNVEMDILNPLTKKFPKSKVFLGKVFIVSNNINLYIRKIDSLNWAYADKKKNTIVGFTKHNHQVVVADDVSPEEIDNILNEIWNINPDMLIGNNDDNQKKYNLMKKESHKL